MNKEKTFKTNKTFEKTNFKNINLENENYNFYDNNTLLITQKDKNINKTDSNIFSQSSRNSKNTLFTKNNFILNFDFEKEKFEFFEFFDYEKLYSFHNLYSKLIKNFELNNNFFEREKILDKFFSIFNSKPYYFPHKIIKYFDDKALNKNLKIYFFIEFSVLALLYHYNIDEYLDLYYAFKHCLFYLNQNLLILTHFVIDKVRKIESNKNDENFQNYFMKYLKSESISSFSNDPKRDSRNFFNEPNILEKHYVKLCNEKLEENKSWLDNNYIFKNFTNNNKNLVNVLRNILEILINIPTQKNYLKVIYYEIKDILSDFSKIKLEGNLDNMNNKVKLSFNYFSL